MGLTTVTYIVLHVGILTQSHARDVTARDSFTAKSGGLGIHESYFLDGAVTHACVTPTIKRRDLHVLP